MQKTTGASPYINHLTINTGHMLRSARADVADDVLRVVAPWLHGLIDGGGRAPLPVQQLAAYSAAAFTDNGGLVLTLYGPDVPVYPAPQIDPAALLDRPSLFGAAGPLVTMGVAQRSRQGRDLWAKLIAHLDVPSNAAKPAEPWCAVVLHPVIAAHPHAVTWLGDLERCVAWAWIAREGVTS